MTSRLLKSPAQQVTFLQRVTWGMVWWGLPFFLLYAFAFALYAGEAIKLNEVLLKLVLSLVGGAVFGLFICLKVFQDRTAREDK